jgi:hypothetical protein
MIGFPIFGKRKPKKPQTLSAAPPKTLPQKGTWPVDRVGFRKPVQG